MQFCTLAWQSWIGLALCAERSACQARTLKPCGWDRWLDGACCPWTLSIRSQARPASTRAQAATISKRLGARAWWARAICSLCVTLLASTVGPAVSHCRTPLQGHARPDGRDRGRERAQPQEIAAVGPRELERPHAVPVPPGGVSGGHESGASFAGPRQGGCRVTLFGKYACCAWFPNMQSKSSPR